MGVSWSLAPTTDDIDDAPIPPPESVASLIPPFRQHGERNCGDHRHDTSKIGFAKRPIDHDKQRLPASAWLMACSNCKARAALTQLHDLPCGHLICRDCLLVKASGVKLSIEKNFKKIRGLRTQICEAEPIPAPTPEMIPRDKTTPRPGPLSERRVVRLAGLTCCGMDMKLGRFLSCLSPSVSRDLWLVLCWIHDSPGSQRACAWPDCGAYLPARCAYKVGHVARRWHCVSCEGNSMDCGRNVEVAQTRFPFLPKGQEALTPSR